MHVAARMLPLTKIGVVLILSGNGRSTIERARNNVLFSASDILDVLRTIDTDYYIVVIIVHIYAVYCSRTRAQATYTLLYKLEVCF
jgi:hypothetical protein